MPKVQEKSGSKDRLFVLNDNLDNTSLCTLYVGVVFSK